MTIDIQEILGFLPHRYPFLLIDRIIEFEPRKRCVAIKNVTINEPFFQGHFPGHPIMPGVLVIEAMAQAGGIIMMHELPDRNEKLVVFTGIERAKFRAQVTPGDQLRMEINVLAFKTRAGRIEGRAYVGDKLACEAVLMCAVVQRVPEAKASAKSPIDGDPNRVAAAAAAVTSTE
ncbi:3-hydroxyacyl-ACP dehydratase FabZ [Occallatibacter riparius]|uniref:3-hydroxyacyl-[acyl-carrier-protein] dehydratase FabZ n=1 Tax=Occallatibacter riparius TaxID=1002689 RepID=A0A9J7BWU1_9BACT|nr:3-hydroxyacyl-ACP dehydratase FabZ [Occallatibacter riparius]UWZ85342.1 3-hydroxyacyl-ACP dehydratase FabZ [Occallatibacter riparius]